MARTPEHTDEKILEACELLAAAGASVTNLSVREKLGGGAFSRIAPIVKEFKSHTRSERQEVAEVETDDLIPADIKDSFLNALRSAITRVQSAADQQIADFDKRCKLTVSAAEQMSGEVIAENEKLNEMILALEVRADRAESGLDSAKKKIESLEKRILKLKSENDAFRLINKVAPSPAQQQETEQAPAVTGKVKV